MARIGQTKAALAARKAAGGGTGKLNASDFRKQADGSYVSRTTGAVSPYQGRPSTPKPAKTTTQGTLPTTPVAPSLSSTTVNSSNIAPVTPITLPDAQTPTYGGIDGAIEGVINQSQAAQEAPKPTAQDNYLKAILEQGTIAESIDRTEQDKAKKESDRLIAELEQEQLANRRRIERLQKNETGMLASGVAIEEERLNRESFSKQADIAILQTAANRNYDTAATIADRQLEMKLEKSKANLEALKLLDQREYGEITQRKEREYKKLEETENAIKQLKLNVAQYGGSLGLLNQLSAIDTSKPGAFDQALRIAGKYASDPLDRAIKQAQLGKLTGGGTTGIVNGKPVQGKTLPSGQLDVVNEVSQVIKSSGEAVPGSAQALGVLSSLQKLAMENTEGRFIGTAPIRLAGRLRGKESRSERIATRGDIGAINLKVQQWASGASLTPDQTKKVNALTPDKNDTDFRVREKINGLTAFMQQQIRSELAAKGIDYIPSSVDYFSTANTTISEDDYANNLLQVGSQSAYNYFE